MSSGIEVSGMDEFIKLTESMTLSPGEETAAMKRSIAIPLAAAKSNAPVLYGVTKASIKGTVKQDGMGLTGIIRVNAWDAVFTEFGTSKSKANINWFGGAIDQSKNEFFKILATQLFSKSK